MSRSKSAFLCPDDGRVVFLGKHVFLVSTETSGDLLAGRLLDALNDSMDDLTVTGVGGDDAEKAGMRLDYHIRDFNVMGLFEVLAKLKQLKAMFNHLVAQVRQRKPDVIVLIDAPDFNLRFAAAVKGLGIPVIYYVSPQVWAWRKGRARKIARLVDHMMVLFSFETEIYRGLNLKTTWVGHPLVDELGDYGDKDSFLREHNLDGNKPLVALAPGSRNSVVDKLLPTMAQVVQARKDRYQFVLPLAGTIDEERVRRILGSDEVVILPGMMRQIMFHADAAVVASGTGTLETGLLRTPLIVGYRLKLASFLLALMLVKTPHVALVNIVLGKRVVPELMQGQFSLDRILPLLDDLVTEGPLRSQMLEEFARLEDILGGGGAATRAARVVKEYLS